MAVDQRALCCLHDQRRRSPQSLEQTRLKRRGRVPNYNRGRSDPVKAPDNLIKEPRLPPHRYRRLSP